MGPWFDFLLACKSLNQINDIEERLKKIGTIFKFKGTKPTMEDLPTEDNEPGDVWSVAGIEYVWAVNESGEGHWEPLGDIIDMDNYVMKADIVQQLGEAEDKIMSQKATKDAIQAYETSMFKELNKVKDYFYTVEYDNIDYAFANKYYETSNDPVEASGCSAVRNGNWYGRNFDWTYDESVDFLVRVPRTNTRYASMGIANGGSALNRQVVQSGIFSDDYRIIPFKVVDGINEKGLVVNSNVVPIDKDPTTGTVPRLEKRESLNMMMLVRYILDNFDDAKKAVEYIRDYVEVTPYAMLSDMGYELHLMVCDKEQSYVLEFAHNAVSIVNVVDKPYMTNFFLTDFTPNADGTVYTPATKDATHSAMTTNGVTEHGDGLERYNLIVGNYASAATKAGMRALMNKLKYTRAYSTAPDVSSPYWYTEFVGGDLTVDSDVSAFASVVEKGGELFANRSRSKTSPYYGTWQSTHSCVYDIDEKKVYIIVQEDGQEMEYGFEFYYDAKEVDAIAEDINDRIDDEVQTLSTRIDTEVETLNSRIDDEVQTLNDKIDSKGHYLGLWDSTTGLCETELAVGTQYVPGDNFVVSKVGSGVDNLIVNGNFDSGRAGWTSTDDTKWTVQNGQLMVLEASPSKDLLIYPSFTEEILPHTTYTIQIDMDSQSSDICFVVALNQSGKPDTTFEFRESGTATFTTLGDLTKFSMKIFKPKYKTGTATFNNILLVQGSDIPSGDSNCYKPNGSEYTGIGKELKDDNRVKVNDAYIYDGENWRWQKNTNTDIEVDDKLSDSSINPVQNKVVTTALGEKLNLSGGTMTGNLDMGANKIVIGDFTIEDKWNEVVFGQRNSSEFADISCSHLYANDIEGTSLKIHRGGISFVETGSGSNTITGLLDDTSIDSATTKGYVDNKDAVLQTSITNEANRATAAEQQIQGNLTNEVNRAITAEQEIKDLIPDVSGFATKEELADAVEPLANKEEVASQISELAEELQSSITSEVTRATAAEQEIAEDLTAEIGRATTAEQEIIESIPDVSNFATRDELADAVDPLATKEELEGTAGELQASITSLENSRSLISETGSIIDLSIDEDTYKVKAILKDKDGNLISTSSEIDLPLEQVVVSISFDEETNTLTFTLKNGETTEVPLGSIITGLASQVWVQNNYYSIDESDTTFATKEALQEVVDDLSALATEVDTKASSADVETAITTVETSLAAETTRATGAEEEIAGNLTAEVARATDAELAIAASIPDITGLATKTELESAIEPLAVKEDVTEEIEIAVADKPTQTEMGEAISTAVSTKQETLVSGTNIKTVNGQSVLGSGNISIKTLSPMKDEWLEASTTEDAVEMIFGDGAQVGEGYLGTVLWGDLPGDLGGAECKAFVISDGIILFELNSADTPPYNWQYNSFAGEWRPLVEPTADGTTTLTVNGTEAGSWSANQEEDNTIELTIPTDYVTEDVMTAAISAATSGLATAKSVTDEQSRAETAESGLSKDISDEVTRAAGAESALSTRISDLSSEVGTKITQTQMQNYITAQDFATNTDLTSNVTTLNNSIAQKANQTALDTISGQVSTLTTTVNGKADNSTVTTLSNTVSALETVVNNKADKPLDVFITQSNDGITINVTYEQLETAIGQRRQINAYYSNPVFDGTCLVSNNTGGTTSSITFTVFDYNGTNFKVRKLTCNGSPNWDIKEYLLTPET